MKIEKQEDPQNTPYSRSCKKLVKHVGAVLALASTHPTIEYKNIKVEYKFTTEEAYLYIPSIFSTTPRGSEKFYDWSFIDKLSELSDNQTISYQIGTTIDFELCVKIFL